MERMRTLERVVETRIDMLEFEKADEIHEDCACCRSLDCDIIFALLFTLVIACLLVLIMVFWLKGVLAYEDVYTRLSRDRAGAVDNCDVEYVDIYSELERAEPVDLLSATLSGRYCGTVSPHIRISLHDVLVLVFHSRAGDPSSRDFRFRGRYSFIDEKEFIPGEPIPGQRCGYVIEPSRYSAQKKIGHIQSATYPGAYPRNFHCAYHLRGRRGERIRLYLQDFDLCFGGEHCPYDTVMIFDGPTTASPIIKKYCGLQLREEVFSVSSELLIHFNTSAASKGDPRGFLIDYEISSRFVDVTQLLGGEKGVSHVRGSECDVRVESHKESRHAIHSPRYPDKYPSNTTCTYILDGLQGEQNLEKAILTFDTLAVISDAQESNPLIPQTSSGGNEEVQCPHAWVGLALSDTNIRATMSNPDESNFDHTLCERFAKDSAALGPYESEGARMVVQFGTGAHTPTDGIRPLGFKAHVHFKTDFGVPGEPMGDSNECKFRFTQPKGFFNSPRYPTNYPLDTKCTFLIVGEKGDVVLIYFEHFSLYDGDLEDKCKDWIEIYDVFRLSNGSEKLSAPAKYCSGTHPGPRRSAPGAHEMRIVFSSDSYGSNNGFKALYEIRKRESLTSMASMNADDPASCGQLKIEANAENPAGFIRSPGFGVKYPQDVHCEWNITARPGNHLLLYLVDMQVEGSMADANTPSCAKAVIRVATATQKYEFCGTVATIISPIITSNNSVQITFLTAPDKVNGLTGFNLSWTEVRPAEEETCQGDDVYLCTYSRLCISSKLRCNGAYNCRMATEPDETDENHCELDEGSADRTLLLAIVVSGVIFTFIASFFCYLFKSKLAKKKKGNAIPPAARLRQRHPAGKAPRTLKTERSVDSGMGGSAASRFAHHDATGLHPPLLTPFEMNNTGGTTRGGENSEAFHTFYG
ncbi:unnamed protein product, partial [Mesorhabditis belari]|uniref:CUB domain-containing protein n=1 Tax=Mesorhabditis belari TaxID=2138241 RepID=A0AAF3ED81_9BILA